MKRLTIVLILFMLLANGAAAQMTRGQLLRKYYQITQLHNSGKDAEAIALCEEITAQYPKLPDTYLRMAQIYDEGGESEMALVMYRTYASLEMNDRKLAETAPRMKELEEKLGAKSFEQQEQEAFDKLIAETAVKEQEKVPELIVETSQPAITSSATSLFDLSTLITSANTKEPEPEPEDEEPSQPENSQDASPEPEGGQEISLFDISAVDFRLCNRSLNRNLNRNLKSRKISSWRLITYLKKSLKKKRSQTATPLICSAGILM